MDNDGTLSEQIRSYPVDALLLDPENPRLAETLKDATQAELLRELYQSYDLEPLLLSLAQSGYFTEEPLIGVPAKPSEEGNARFTIVEGNRRLAALKILLFGWAREATGIQSLPDVEDEVSFKLSPVPVKEYPSRNDVVPYLGVRHIRGVKDWDALAKARYVRWLRENSHSIKDISRLVGDRGDVVRRWLLTLYVLEQANSVSDEPWNVAPKEFKFSWLYTALGYASIRENLGLPEESRQDPTPNPVTKDKTRHLTDHLNDLYGPPPGDRQKAKVRESREIRRLAAVYSSTEALDSLRGGSTLDVAYARSTGEEEELVDHLQRANVSLDNANGMAHRHKSHNEALRLAHRAADTAANVVKTLEG